MNGIVRSVGPSSRYTVLASNVSKILASLPEYDMRPTDQKVVIRAADLLATIIQGSRFVERRDGNILSNAHENLLAVDHALAALQSLDWGSERNRQLTQTFEQLEDDLRSLAMGVAIDRPRIKIIARFFDALAEMFYRDIADSAVAIPNADFERTLA